MASAAHRCAVEHRLRITLLKQTLINNVKTESKLKIALDAKTSWFIEHCYITWYVWKYAIVSIEFHAFRNLAFYKICLYAGSTHLQLSLRKSHSNSLRRKFRNRFQWTSLAVVKYELSQQAISSELNMTPKCKVQVKSLLGLRLDINCSCEKCNSIKRFISVLPFYAVQEILLPSSQRTSQFSV
jgi:hypothetical protein